MSFSVPVVGHRYGRQGLRLVGRRCSSRRRTGRRLQLYVLQLLQMTLLVMVVLVLLMMMMMRLNSLEYGRRRGVTVEGVVGVALR